jgi:hypothetical protein
MVHEKIRGMMFKILILQPCSFFKWLVNYIHCSYFQVAKTGAGDLEIRVDSFVAACRLRDRELDFSVNNELLVFQS